MSSLGYGGYSTAELSSDGVQLTFDVDQRLYEDEWVSLEREDPDWDDGPFIDVRSMSIAFYEEEKFVKGFWWFIIFLTYFLTLLTVLVFQMNVKHAYDFDQMLQDRYFYSKFGINMDMVRDVSSVDMIYEYLSAVWVPNTFGHREGDSVVTRYDTTPTTPTPTPPPPPPPPPPPNSTPVLPPMRAPPLPVPMPPPTAPPTQPTSPAGPAGPAAPAPASPPTVPPSPAPPTIPSPMGPASPAPSSPSTPSGVPAGTTPQPRDIMDSDFPNPCPYKPLTNITEWSLAHSKLARTPLLWQARVQTCQWKGKKDADNSKGQSGRVLTRLPCLTKKFSHEPFGPNQKFVPHWEDPDIFMIPFCINTHCLPVTKSTRNMSNPKHKMLHVNVTCTAAATSAIDQLRKDNWIDEKTAFVVAQTTYYNPFYNMAALLRLVFVQTSGGRVIALAGWGDPWAIKHQSSTIQVQRLWDIEANTDDIVHFVLAAVFTLLTFAATVYEVALVWKAKKQSHSFLNYFRQARNVIQLATLVLTYVAIVFYVVFLTTSGVDHEDKDTHPLFLAESFDFGSRTIYWVFTAVLILLFTARVLCSIAFAPRWRFLSLTIVKAGPELLSFAAIVALILLGYSMSGYYYFGHGIKNFSDPIRGVQTLLLMSIGMPRTEYDDLAGTTDVSLYTFPFMFYWSFILIFYFAMINMALAIVMGAYSAVADDQILHKNVPQRAFHKKILKPWGRVLGVLQARGWLDLVYHEYPVGVNCSYHFVNMELVLRMKINMLSQTKVASAKHLMIALPPGWTIERFQPYGQWEFKKAAGGNLFGAFPGSTLLKSDKNQANSPTAVSHDDYDYTETDSYTNTGKNEVLSGYGDYGVEDTGPKKVSAVGVDLVSKGVNDTGQFTPIVRVNCPAGFETHDAIIRLKLDISEKDQKKRYVSGEFQVAYTENGNLAIAIGGEGASFELLPYLVLDPRISIHELLAAPAESGAQPPRRSKWHKIVQHCEKHFPWQEA